MRGKKGGGESADGGGTGPGRGAEWAVSRALRVFSKKLLRCGGVHFGGVWGVVGREEFGDFGPGRARDGAAGGGVGVAEELNADGMRVMVWGAGRGTGGGKGSENGMRLRLSRD